MADYKKIVQGQMFFFIGFIYILIMSYIIPPIITAGEAILPGTDVTSVVWIMVLVFYVFMGLIIPINLIYLGIVDNSKDQKSAFMQIILALSMFLVAVALTVKGWYIILALADTVSGDFVLTAVFWTGLLLSWVLCNVVAPVALITQAYQKGETGVQ